MVDVSVLIPVYNEEESLRPLAGELSGVLDRLDKPYEVIFVDDGSSDGSFEVLRELALENPRIKVIRLARNFGQTAALRAGLDEARGEVIVTLDADLQNDPADIPSLLEKLDQGFDAVSGWRKNRKDKFLSRRLPSLLANTLISRCVGLPIHDFGCTLKAYGRSFVKAVRPVGEMHRFLIAEVQMAGARVAEVEVRHRARPYGQSKYGWLRALKVPLDLATVLFMQRYLTKPIYLFGGSGIALGILSAVLSAAVLFKKFYLGIFVKDQPLFLVSIFFGLVGIQLVLMGLLAEILIRTYHEIENRPTYFIREKIAGEKNLDLGALRK